MKKLIIAVMIAMSVLVVAACNSDETLLSKVYEVGGESLASDSFNHTNVISDNVIRTQERTVGEKITFSASGHSYSLLYDSSIFYPLENHKVHKYVIEDREEASVLLNEDGSLFAILNETVAVLDISETDTPETVRIALERAIIDLVDLSKYDKVEVQCFNTDTDGPFGYYRYIFYDEIQGYRGNHTMVAVSDDGRVHALWIIDLWNNAEELPVIDKENEEQLIHQKLQAIYNTDTTEYRSHTLFSESSICSYGNELCIYYRFNVTIYDTGYDVGTNGDKEKSGLICDLVIPVRLLAEK